MRTLHKLSAIGVLIAMVVLAGCAQIPSKAPEDCTITELTGNCPVWMRQ